MTRLASWILLAGCLAGCAEPEVGLGLADTDLYVVAIEGTGDRPSLGPPVNLTSRAGYDNQPAFLADGSGLLYASDEGEDVDIWHYDFEDGAARRLTEDWEREYSPAPIPGRAGFSAVRVEEWADQRLWAYDSEGARPELLFEWEDEVGYYVWIDETLVALCVLDDEEPAELRIANVLSGWVEDEAVAVDIGRSLNRIPGRNAISFLQRDLSGDRIFELDLLTRAVTPIVDAPPESLDHAWTPDGTLIVSQGKSLLAFRPGTDTEWFVLADFSGEEFLGLSRPVVSPDGTRLVFVAESPPAETPGTERP